MDEDTEVFDVWDGKTLWAADYGPPRDRADAYAVSEKLVQFDFPYAVENCEPLAWHLESELKDTLGSAALPKDAEQLAEFIKTAPQPIISKLKASAISWLRADPEFEEGGHFAMPANAQDAAFQHFSAVDSETLDLLNIEIVEGEHPGSTYYAAELRCDVEEANRISREHDLGYLFRVRYQP